MSTNIKIIIFIIILLSPTAHSKKSIQESPFYSISSGASEYSTAKGLKVTHIQQQFQPVAFSTLIPSDILIAFTALLRVRGDRLTVFVR